MSADLWDILNDPSLTRNVRRMFRIGTEAFHESAFAVYSSLGSYSVSKLLVPDITHTDLLDERTVPEHVGLDISGLTTTPLDEQAEHEYDKAISSAHVDTFSEKAKLAINRIKADTELSEWDRDDLIEAIIKRELKLIKPTPNVREDLLVVAHNHPLVPLARWSLSKLLRPSDVDVRYSYTLFTHNPRMIEAVVAADSQAQGMLLYARDQRTVQRPEL